MLLKILTEQGKADNFGFYRTNDLWCFTTTPRSTLEN